MSVGASLEWRDVTYNDTFQQELRGLKRRLENDSSCTKADIHGILRNLYIMEGADWGGRGEVQDTILSATIAAYEHFLAELGA